MIIAVDEAIPFLQPALAEIGNVKPFSGRAVSPGDVRDADALIVRSITRVGAALLAGSSVRFVGTVSIGTDHLDMDYLAARNIHCANAAGSNAHAVAEYVIAALLVTAERKNWDLSGKSLAIIGVGHIGTLVEKMAAALGMEVLLCDPPLRESTGDTRYGYLDDVLKADFLTLHVPLTTDGPYPTRHMINQEVFQRLSPRQFVINSARGAVVCGPDLKDALHARRIGGAILDVWEEEPGIDLELLDLVDIGTPHIAGSSQDGKMRGTARVFGELCGFLGIPDSWDHRNIEAPAQRLHPGAAATGLDAVRSVVLQAYDILRDDANLRSLKGISKRDIALRFDHLRNGYTLRPEFSHFIVERVKETSLALTLEVLGFKID